ncbi:MAG TPA: RluA family pseudouridine synthase [Candidatus Limnocylindrales bacterium]|nr:RluA family pseudouridine synthase [Candidatus Limnocylindrales bacterium]
MPDAGPMTLVVPDGTARSRRADRFVADVTGLSRTFVQRLLAEGRLTRNGITVRSSGPVVAGESLVLDVPEARPIDHIGPDPTIGVSVAYEDDDVLVVDKQAGIVVHPSPGHRDGTLVNALLARPGDYGAIAGVMRPGIVHRLDRDTSGLLIVARTDVAQQSLMAQMKARRIKKTYLALVAGDVVAPSGRIEAPIGRHPRHRTQMAVTESGRPAVTGYRVRERFGDWTLLDLDLVTGRTHQIRVHLEAIGHPVAGDRVYGTGTSRRGPDGLGRMFLHAWRLEFVSPTSGRLVRVAAELPDELATVLARLRGRGKPAAS